MSMAPDPELVAFAREKGLLGANEAGLWTALTGGVSSDIWRLDAGGRSVCVKRALEQLKVAADWRVPVARNLYEWRWIETVWRALPGATPEPLAMDDKRGAFAMAFLPAADFPLWKKQLLDGDVRVETAADVGRLLGKIHAFSALDGGIARQFATDDLFHALRIEPYLLATAERHPSIAARIREIAARTASTKQALVHGDVSPKNILVGADGPVLLDAECAWWGDPAFDLAFCLNHLLLKQIAVPHPAGALKDSFRALADAYLPLVAWESRDEMEARTAALLPALLLARVDGKSPVEYLGDEAGRVRAAALALLNAPQERLGALQSAFTQATEQT